MQPQEAPLRTPPPVADTQPQVAIIVPVYNVAPYLSRCIESLVAQSIPVQIVLVDDGATDASGAIADWYAQRHANIQVVHQQNKGPGAARNAGLAASTAPFVTFVDSDDYVATDFVERMLTGIRRSQADIAICTYTTITRLGFHFRPIMHKLLPPTLTGAKALRLILRDTSIQNYCWNKLFRRTLFTDQHIAFPHICYEDIATMPRLFSRARRVAVVQDALYFYCRRPGSLLAIYTPERITDGFTALAMVRDFLIDSQQYRKFRWAFQFLIHKFAIYIAADTIRLYFKRQWPGAARAAWAAYLHTLDLATNDVIAIHQGMGVQAADMLQK